RTDTVIVGTRRHAPVDCPLIQGAVGVDVETMTLSQAEDAGLTACSVCQLDRQTVGWPHLFTRVAPRLRGGHAGLLASLLGAGYSLIGRVRASPSRDRTIARPGRADGRMRR